MNGREEVSCEFVVARGNPSEILEPAEAPLDDIASLVGDFVEVVSPYAIGLVGNDRSGPASFDRGAKGIAVITFVGDDGFGSWRERQNVRRGSDIRVLAGGQVKCDGSAKRIAERMDFRAATAARTADRLRVLPPFPPAAQR